MFGRGDDREGRWRPHIAVENHDEIFTARNSIRPRFSRRLCRRRREHATENDDKNEEAKEFEGEETKFKSRRIRRHRNKARERML